MENGVLICCYCFRQPDIPYALGGCIVEETMFQQTDINFIIERINSFNEFVSENLISIGLFTVPKNVENATEKCNFEMYSLVIESSEWDKPKIQQAINEVNLFLKLTIL